MFVLYALIGGVVWFMYRRLPAPISAEQTAAAPLGPSKAVVVRLAVLFSLDSFAGGLVVNAILALWLFQRFDLSVSAAGAFFFWSGLCSAASQLAAPRLAARIGLLNTMVFTHIPASVCLIGAAFAADLWMALGLLMARSLLSQMDVPARSAFVMSVVTPAERAAAASFTAVPRSLASAAGPTIGAALFAGGWMAAPLVACGVLKIAYDLAIWRGFRSTASHSDQDQRDTR
jgi:MFS family permease